MRAISALLAVRRLPHANSAQRARYTMSPYVRAAAFASLLVVCSQVTAQSIAVPRTGQSACYSSLGQAVSCVRSGQDADPASLIAGAAWPTPRFVTVGDVAIDQLTGLGPSSFSVERNIHNGRW